MSNQPTTVIEYDEHGQARVFTIHPDSCPHVIWAPEHYRDDGSCRCDDPTHQVMSEWGYVWDGDRWAAPVHVGGHDG